jgi:hypothetical protein
VTLSTDIFIVIGVLYFNLRSANEHVLKIKETSVKISGVQLPEPLESAKITGVYMDQEPMLPEPNGVRWTTKKSGAICVCTNA